MRSLWFAALLPGLAGCGPDEPPVPAPDAASLLAEAQAAFDRNPDDEASIIWLGRRLAYLGRFRDAIAVYSGGLERRPESYRLLRHRGHRYITVREFDLAIADLERAARLCLAFPDEVEPDGLPNARNTPTGTDRTNIYYHLGLARYLAGRFGEAAAAWRQCLDHSANDDMRVAACYWLYLSLRRAGRDEDAEAVLVPIHRDLDVFENFAYHRLLLVFKGEMTADEAAADPASSPVGPAVDGATLGYGLAAWHAMHGRRGAAAGQYRSVLAGDARAAFGFIAAERDVAADPGLLDGGP
jgi:tetratricopeptide (TPR) repeat protein